MPLSFVVELCALLLFGPAPALFVAASGLAVRCIAAPERAWPLRRAIVSAGAVFLAIGAASLVQSTLAPVVAPLEWRWRQVSVVAAAAVYCVVATIWGEVAAPRLTRQGATRSWLRAIMRNAPNYVIGASVAVAVVELIDRGLWEWLAVGALPLYCGYRAYSADLDRVEDESRRREVIAELNQGMAVVNPRREVVLWNDDLERILDCPRRRALGRPLAGAVPALGRTQVLTAIDEVATSRVARTLPHVSLALPAGTRTMQIKLLPVADGVTLLWHDITETTLAERALRRSQERLSLAAEGAKDGLWEWDMRTHAFYVSDRWKAMVGLPANAAISRCEDWLNRVHPEDATPLKSTIETHLAGATDHFQYEHRIQHEDGTYRRFLCRGIAARAAGNKAIRIAGSLTDMTDQAMAQEQLRLAEFRDPLTGLCNRAVFVERVARRLDEFKRAKGGETFATLYLDLDRFKVVNDSLGHLVGDHLLTAVSRRLESCLRTDDAIARLGGDEFAILLNEIIDAAQANAIAFRIQKALSAPFSIGGREVFTSASIGIAVGLAHYSTPDEIMRDADTAMYHAKTRGKARHELFDADMHARTRDRLGLENDLRHAIDNHDLVVHYQPIVLLESRKCVGFESLVRWTRNGESVSPATFIPLAEELGLIEPLGTWILQQACRTFADWKRRYVASGIDYITVNVSSRQLMQQNFMLVVEEAVDTARLQPCDLRLEITETALMDSPTVAAKLLSDLRDFGVKIYLDDFGTGYSSLSHLHKLPVDALKIDRSFVRSLSISDRPAIVESILALARTMNTSVVAEGIESDDQACELERLGCTHAQGYLFSRPLSDRAAEQLLAANLPLGPKPISGDEAISASLRTPALSLPL